MHVIKAIALKSPAERHRDVKDGILATSTRQSRNLLMCV